MYGCDALMALIDSVPEKDRAFAVRLATSLIIAYLKQKGIK